MERCHVILKKTEDARIRMGHPWVFGNEVLKFEGPIKSGEIAEVYSFEKEFLGIGFLNTSSKIIVRILSTEKEEVNFDFFKSRIMQCKTNREALGYSDNYRLVFGESDYLPGLIIDKYGEYFSCQFLSLGMDLNKESIIRALVELFAPKGIMERSDVPVRLKEGLEEFKGVIYGSVPDKVEIFENEIKLKIDLLNGQKTGYFLDQKENRANLKHYVKDKIVLDCFSNVGGFALNAFKNFAKKVIACDISKKACENIKENALMNQFDIEVIEDNVFDLLRRYQKENKWFDVVILDPPAFSKSKEKINEAYKGYKEINKTALKIICKGGYLVTCSCTQKMVPDLFLKMLYEASFEANRKTRLIEFRIQGKDHPSILGSEEPLYLKCVILQVF